ncbi:hypothetical protein KW797_04020 [Candidatus Parcubacteria bacterium]|nr:hypothetical protein [Candidatus Parcubacteria bacterium]
MTIPDLSLKIKRFWADLSARVGEPRVYFSLVLVLVAAASFGLGRLSWQGSSAQSVRITGGLERAAAPVLAEGKAEAQTAAALSADPAVYASKNGTKYYFQGCSGLDRIKKENLISFKSEEEAKRAGLTLASGCAQ